MPPFCSMCAVSYHHPTSHGMAVVGTRAPSQEGLAAASQCGVALAEAGIPMVSGIARGIDAAAHAGTIRSGGHTIAVMGCGIDRIYPTSNRQLAVGILDSGGAVISEYPPGVQARQYHFPARNRIISGLASSVVVVEAPPKSRRADYRRTCRGPES